MKYWTVRAASIMIAVLGCLALDLASSQMSSFTQRLIMLAGLYVTLAVSLNLINGITGQFSIGHAAFYQVGAYTTGVLARSYFAAAHLPPGLWLLLMMIAGGIGAAIAGLIVGLPSLRLRGDYLAIVTLGFGQIINIVAKNQEGLGKAYGMNVAPRFQYVWIVWLLAVVCIAVCRNLLKNVHGLSFLAVREDEIAGSAMGVNVTRVKVTAFVLGSAFAGAAGALLAHNEGFISPAMFTMDTSFIILTMVVLGGTGSITGSVVAALVLFYIPEKMRDLTNIQMSSILAIAIALVISVVLIKRFIDRFHGEGLRKALVITGIVVGGLILEFLLSGLLGHKPGNGTVIEGAIFTTLVALAVSFGLTAAFMNRLGGAKKPLTVAGIRVAGLAVGLIPGLGATWLLTHAPGLEAQVEGSKLRLVVFAVTLVILMLLRPQGMFAHHEFSWSWVKKIFGRKDMPETAVSA